VENFFNQNPFFSQIFHVLHLHPLPQIATVLFVLLPQMAVLELVCQE